MKYNDGSTYDGEWKDGKRNGQGVMKYPSGQQYDGEWKNGKKHGRGAVFCDWVNGHATKKMRF